MKPKAKPKKKNDSMEMVVKGILSYPHLRTPRAYDEDSKAYYQTDILFEADDEQLATIRKNINKVRVGKWGEDKTEWPKEAAKRFLIDGNTRADQATYKDRFYIAVKTGEDNEVPIITPKGQPFTGKVEGGMIAEVAIRISPWSRKNKEGLSLWLQAVMIDPKTEKLPGFGGAKSAKTLFGLEDADESEDHDTDNSDDADDEEDDTPRGKKKPSKKKPVDEDEDEDEDDSDDNESDDEEE